MPKKKKPPACTAEGKGAETIQANQSERDNNQSKRVNNFLNILPAKAMWLPSGPLP